MGVGGRGGAALVPRSPRAAIKRGASRALGVLLGADPIDPAGGQRHKESLRGKRSSEQLYTDANYS